jgi:hypothetical protein
MISILRHIFVGLIAASTFSCVAYSQSTHTYRIGWYPLNDSECRTVAVDIGERFAAATGHQVLAAGCERPFSWKQDVVIQYFADAEANLVSTFGEFATSAQGFYPTAQSCEADLQNEVALFENSTGIEAVTYFCYPETKQTRDNKYPYISRIDGFGFSEKKPFVFTASIYNQPTISAQNMETLFNDSLNLFSSLDSPRVKVDFSGSLPRVTIKYYSTRQRPLTLETVMSFESLAACESNRISTDQIFSSFGIEGLRSFCGRKEFLQSASLTYFGLVTGAYKVELIPGSFPSRSACEGAMSGIEARYAAATDSQHVKAICTFERPEIFSDEAYFVKVLVQI